MTGKCFVDTNIWVSARNGAEPAKQQRASALLETLGRQRKLVISVQVISEFYEALRRRVGPSSSLTAAAEAMLDLEPMPLNPDTLRRAFDLRRNWNLSWWDAMIVSTAIAGSCHILYSEDLQSGARIGGVEIVNPFLSGGLEK